MKIKILTLKIIHLPLLKITLICLKTLESLQVLQNKRNGKIEKDHFQREKERVHTHKTKGEKLEENKYKFEKKISIFSLDFLIEFEKLKKKKKKKKKKEV